MELPASSIRDDFDRIARFARDGWDHNQHYHRFLLQQVPGGCDQALDVGSGTGSFTRLLAERCRRVVGIDFSPEMVRTARDRARHLSNVEFVVADAATWDYPPSYFDFVVSIATLHHLPMVGILESMARTVKVGGVVAVLDLLKAGTMAERLAGAWAIPVAFLLRVANRGPMLEPRELREAWRVHGRNETYPTLRSVRETVAPILPGALVRRHLLWRYSIVWRKAA